MEYDEPANTDAEGLHRFHASLTPQSRICHGETRTGILNRLFGSINNSHSSVSFSIHY
jgi:hypothetical protein